MSDAEKLQKTSDDNQKCLQKITTKEKILLVIVTLLVTLCIAMLGLVIYLSIRKLSNEVCLSKKCVEVAAKTIKNIDFDADPCHDFYQFTCGNFAQSLPDHKAKIAQTDIVSDTVDGQLKKLFEEPIDDDDIKPIAILKSIYQTCMNKRQFEKESFGKLKEILREMGGWPVVEEGGWNPMAFNWEETSHGLMARGLPADGFFRFQTLPDPKNSSRNVLHLDQPHIINQSLLKNGVNDTVVKAYYDFMVKVAMIFGADERRATKEMHELAELLITLSRFVLLSGELDEKSEAMSLHDLQLHYPYVNWLSYVNHMIRPMDERSYNDTVVVASPKYFQYLKDVFDQSRVSARTVANYLMWNALNTDLLQLLHDDLQTALLEFSRSKSGTLQLEPRWKICTRIVTRMHIACGSLYIRNYFEKGSKEAVVEIVKNIQEQFVHNLDMVDWMDEETKQKAKEKAKAVSVFVGYPDELLDDDKIEEYYRDLNVVNGGNILEALLNLTRFLDYVEFSDLDRTNDKSDWRLQTLASQSHASYDQTANSLKIPAGLLQGVFFEADRPKYLNYGGIGYLIGHEIIHGFDDEGGHFDPDGNLETWWRDETAKGFEGKASCVIEQYSNLTVTDDVVVDGLRTLSENVADNGGIKQAYRAYKKWAEMHGAEQNLPGLPFNPQQMFWISAGNSMCAKVRREQLKIDVVAGMHAPARYRINVPVMNSRDFARDFGCPAGSAMNPDRRCAVW